MQILISGKDKVVIATVEDLNQPCKANIVIEKPKEEPGKITTLAHPLG